MDFRKSSVLQLCRFLLKNKYLCLSSLLVCVAVKEVSMAEDDKERGYHNEVGIPVARRIYMAETTAAPSESKVISPTSLAIHPYLAGVVINVKEAYSVCGSSILSHIHAITAAHCWWDGWTRAERFTLVFGSEYIFVGGIRVETSNVQTHPSWDTMTISNDLAMITFPYTNFTEYIQPIALPLSQRRNRFLGYLVLASGYGKIEPGTIGYYPNQVETDVILKIVESNNCVTSSTVLMIKSLCALNEQNPSQCISHSGGPLVTIHNNQRFLIGVATSGDYKCKSKLSEYVRVTSYLSWILRQMKVSL